MLSEIAVQCNESGQTDENSHHEANKNEIDGEKQIQVQCINESEDHGLQSDHEILQQNAILSDKEETNNVQQPVQQSVAVKSADAIVNEVTFDNYDDILQHIKRH